MNIFSLDHKVDVSWHPEVAAVLETWQDCDVDLESFRKAVFVKGINHAKASQARAWILDTSAASGPFSAEVETMIAENRFPALAWVGARWWVEIDPTLSASEVTPGSEATRQLTCVRVPSQAEAFAWLKAQA